MLDKFVSKLSTVFREITCCSWAERKVGVGGVSWAVPALSLFGLTATILGIGRENLEITLRASTYDI